MTAGHGSKLTPDRVARWLRLFYAEGDRRDASFPDRPDLRAEIRATRRDSRRWRNQLIGLPAFRRAVVACEGMTEAEMFGTLTRLISRVGFVQSRWGMHERDPLHPSAWRDERKRLRDDAERLRAVAARRPHMAPVLLEHANALQCAAEGSPDQHYPFDADNIGTRGAAAADPDSAMRGWMTAEVFALLPERTEQPYAAAAELLTHAGMSIRPDRVRTIIANRRRG